MMAARILFVSPDFLKHALRRLLDKATTKDCIPGLKKNWSTVSCVCVGINGWKIAWKRQVL
ncbi:MAG: hypothetical protein A4E63_00732 [Syntrophorhabdus sp. PtaU1.Bin050]|nr:MAG: hypothetical protein A4E63_00732 [Syntrophorhabdus sp. PtaU1.Bin050]